MVMTPRKLFEAVTRQAQPEINEDYFAPYHCGIQLTRATTEAGYAVIWDDLNSERAYNQLPLIEPENRPVVSLEHQRDVVKAMITAAGATEGTTDVSLSRAVNPVMETIHAEVSELSPEEGFKFKEAFCNHIEREERVTKFIRAVGLNPTK